MLIVLANTIVNLVPVKLPGPVATAKRWIWVQNLAGKSSSIYLNKFLERFLPALKVLVLNRILSLFKSINPIPNISYINYLKIKNIKLIVEDSNQIGS